VTQETARESIENMAGYDSLPPAWRAVLAKYGAPPHFARRCIADDWTGEEFRAFCKREHAEMHHETMESLR